MNIVYIYIHIHRPICCLGAVLLQDLLSGLKTRPSVGQMRRSRDKKKVSCKRSSGLCLDGRFNPSSNLIIKWQIGQQHAFHVQGEHSLPCYAFLKVVACYFSTLGTISDIQRLSSETNWKVRQIGHYHPTSAEITPSSAESLRRL